VEYSAEKRGTACLLPYSHEARGEEELAEDIHIDAAALVLLEGDAAPDEEVDAVLRVHVLLEVEAEVELRRGERGRGRGRGSDACV
jgi:hypothetical protein